MAEMRNPDNDAPAITAKPILKESLGLNLGREQDWAYKFIVYPEGVRSVPKPKIVAVTDDEYKAETAVLPLDAFADDFPLPAVLPPANHIYCVTALALTDDCLAKGDLDPDEWDDFVNSGDFIRGLIVDPADNLTYGFGEYDGYFYDHLPARLKADISQGGCSFVIDFLDERGQTVSDADKPEWFAKRKDIAYANLKAFLREPLGQLLQSTSPLPGFDVMSKLDLN